MTVTSSEEEESEGLKNENTKDENHQPIYVDLDKPVE